MAWTDPRTWVAGEAPTATIMNTHIRDNFKAIGDPWTSYTPTWTSTGTNPTIGNGTLTGAYMRAGNLVIGRLILVFGSTSSVGTGQYNWSLPTTANYNDSINIAIGVADMFDTSASAHTTEAVVLISSSTFEITSGIVTATTPYAWADGDHITCSFMYETG